MKAAQSVFECPIFQSHIQKTTEAYDLFLKAYSIDMTSDLVLQIKNIPKEAGENIISHLETVSVYAETFDGLCEKYHFPKDDRSRCQSLLEIAAMVYIGENLTLRVRPFLNGLEKEINALQNNIDKFRYALKPLSNIEDNIDSYFEGPSVANILKSTHGNLDDLAALKGRLRKSWPGNQVKLGNNAPLGNPGLKQFILVMLDLWTDVLNRTLKQEHDGINGRKQFLEFLEDCKIPLHPRLTYDSIDNALRKVQVEELTNLVNLWGQS